jgi:hypothetical protein
VRRQERRPTRVSGARRSTPSSAGSRGGRAGTPRPWRVRLPHPLHDPQPREGIHRDVADARQRRCPLSAPDWTVPDGNVPNGAVGRGIAGGVAPVLCPLPRGGARLGRGRGRPSRWPREPLLAGGLPRLLQRGGGREASSSPHQGVDARAGRARACAGASRAGAPHAGPSRAGSPGVGGLGAAEAAIDVRCFGGRLTRASRIARQQRHRFLSSPRAPRCSPRACPSPSWSRW